MAPSTKKEGSQNYDHVRYDSNGNLVVEGETSVLEGYSDAVTGTIGSAVYNSASYVSSKIHNVYEWTTSKLTRKEKDEGLPMYGNSPSLN